MLTIYAVSIIETDYLLVYNIEEIVMKTIATTLLVSSLVLGGFAVASDYDDRYERKGHYEKGDRYDRGGHKGKYCDKRTAKSGHRMEYMIKKLDLNDSQTTQVRNIRDSYQSKMESLRSKMKDSRKQLRDTMHEDTIDQGKVRELAQTIGALKTDKIILRSAMRTDIHNVLSTKQRKELKKLQQYRGSEYEHGYDS